MIEIGNGGLVSGSNNFFATDLAVSINDARYKKTWWNMYNLKIIISLR